MNPSARKKANMKMRTRNGMRWNRWLLFASAYAAVIATAGTAAAQQIDTNPPAPNVLLLLDNSGSMERMIDGTTPESNVVNQCNIDPASGAPISGAAQPTPNRWGTMVQALTGTFQHGYNCAAMPRTAAGVFGQEYQIASTQPYDTDYYLPYHRPVFSDTSTVPATSCVIAPGALPGAAAPNGVGPGGLGGSGGNPPGSGRYATDFPGDGIIMRGYNQLGVRSNAATGTCSQWPGNQYTTHQFTDGAIPSSTSLMRFGLMTFDQDPDPGTGVTPNSTTPTVQSPAFTGMWSYFPSWNAGGTCPYSGDPVGCTAPQLFAVGARNPAAPPWEGRMMPFPTASDITSQQTNNQNISDVILATRPYGATPLAGMFYGAKYYLWNDPQGPQNVDPLVRCDNRPQYIIVLTDGAPNLDLRPDCTNQIGSDAGNVTGTCPFPDKPEATAQKLFAGSGNMRSVMTFVLGFAVSSVQDGSINVQCSSLVNKGTLASQCLTPPAPPAVDKYAACCQLLKIANAGSGGKYPAYFADTPGDLQKALGDILAIIGSNQTTRTTPAYSPAPSSVLADATNATNVGASFLAYFFPSPGLPWTGTILRKRQVCTPQTGGFSQTPPPIDPTKGDDFAANVNSNIGTPRTFIALQPNTIGSGSTVDPTTTIRPYVSTTVGDGVGQYGATTYVGPATNVIPNLSPAALNIPATCAYTSSTTHKPATLTQAQCTTMTLDYTFATPSFTSNPGDFPFVSRYGGAFGDIFHATPTVVGPPGTLLEDPSYTGFASNFSTRETIVYAATNDGLLHAFFADQAQLGNNERWAMLLPSAMTSLYPSYPSSHLLLLDGAPIVKDVAWDRSIATSADPTAWHTMLVAGYGPSRQGYYAVDVTDPNVGDLTRYSGGVPPSVIPPPGAGPVFRWQLTKMPATNFQLFGAQSSTPAITTLYMDPGDGGGKREIGVAILPGGSNGGPSTSAGNGAACARATKSSDSAPLSGYTYRTGVRCWGSKSLAADAVVGRSVTVVRIDTGEILRVFGRQADFPATDTVSIANRVTNVALDSPMTGTPLVYPADVGTPSTKFFVSDADGTIWRFDVSNPDPTQWAGELYLDLYNQTVDTNATAWSDGQPLQVPMTLTLDNAGKLVINAASGTTDTFDSTGIDFVYSITEKVQGTTPKLRAFVNWYLGSPLTTTGTVTTPPTPQTRVTNPAFLPGERVSGPMTVFDGTLYFTTYAAAQTPTVGQPCSNSLARLWGVDFVTPDTVACLDPTASGCTRSAGGEPRLNPTGSTTGAFANITPFAGNATLQNAVIPGLSIQATPACASAGPSPADPYVPGATHSTPQNFTSGSYSVFSQVGGGGTGPGGQGTLSVSVPTPVSPTLIDSWAGVLE